MATHHKDRLHLTAMAPLLQHLNMADTHKRLHNPATAAIIRPLLQVNTVLPLLLSTEVALPHQPIPAFNRTLTTKEIIMLHLHLLHKPSPSAPEHQVVIPSNIRHVRVAGKPYSSVSIISASEDN